MALMTTGPVPLALYSLSTGPGLHAWPSTVMQAVLSLFMCLSLLVLEQALRTMGMSDMAYWLSWGAWEVTLAFLQGHLVAIFGGCSYLHLKIPTHGPAPQVVEPEVSHLIVYLVVPTYF